MARVLYSMNRVLWTPSLGVKFLLPESRKSYFIFFTRRLLSQLVQLYIAALVFSLLLLAPVFVNDLNAGWVTIFLTLCPFSFFLHLAALVFARISSASKHLKRANYVFVFLSCLALLIILIGVDSLNSFIARLHVSCSFLLFIVITFYVQESSFLTVLLIFVCVVFLMSGFVDATH